MTFCGESVPAAAAVALRAKHETRRKVVLAADEGREEALSLSRHDHTGRIRGLIALSPERKRQVYAPAGLQ